MLIPAPVAWVPSDWSVQGYTVLSMLCCDAEKLMGLVRPPVGSR